MEALVLEKEKEAERKGAVQEVEENWPLSRTVLGSREGLERNSDRGVENTLGPPALGGGGQ